MFNGFSSVTASVDSSAQEHQYQNKPFGVSVHTAQWLDYRRSQHRETRDLVLQ
jgi:hypothetical protein